MDIIKTFFAGFLAILIAVSMMICVFLFVFYVSDTICNPCKWEITYTNANNQEVTIITGSDFRTDISTGITHVYGVPYTKKKIK